MKFPRLITLALAVFTLTSCDSGPHGAFSASSFDSAKWKSDRSARYAMSKDVAFKEIQAGNNKKSVLEKLGEPDRKVPAQLGMEYWYYDLPFTGKDSKPNVNILINGDYVTQTSIDFVGDEGHEASEDVTGF